MFEMRQRRYFQPAQRNGVWQWFWGEEPSGSISISVGPYCLSLECRFTLDEQEYHLWIRLTKTLCHFGGYRFWFLCPQCNRRIGILYVSGSYFACRRCHGLTYRSRLQPHTNTMGALVRLIKKDKLGDRYIAKRTKYWNGRPTRKHQAWLKKRGRLLGAGRDLWQCLDPNFPRGLSQNQN